MSAIKLAVIGACLVLACSDKGTEPQQVRYNIYLSSRENGNLYILNADSLTITDSIMGVASVSSMAVSLDGRWIYTQSSNPPRRWYFSKIDAMSRTKVDSIATESTDDFIMLEEGTTLLRGREDCHREVFDPRSLQAIDSIPDSVCGLWGTPDGTSIVVLVNSESRVSVFDLDSREFQGEYSARSESGSDLKVIQCALAPDGFHIVMIASTPALGSWALVAELRDGTTLFRKQIGSAYGEVAVSDDGLVAAVSDPGDPYFDGSPPELHIIDLDGLELIGTLRVVDGDISASPVQLRFIPGSHLLVAAGDWNFAGPLQIIDVSTMSLRNIVFEPFSGYRQGVLAVARRP